MSPLSGLREQKKAMTRQSIADITLRMTLDKGLSYVTIEEIGREAFVSPRTVTNYFSHKEEAIAAAGRLSTIEIVDQLLEQPQGEDPLHSLSRVMMDLLNTLTPDDLRVHRQKLKLAEVHPAVKSFLAASYQELEERLAVVIASRTGTDSAIDVYPRLLAAAAVDALRLSLQLWATSDSGLTLTETIQAAFSMMQTGFPTTSVA